MVKQQIYFKLANNDKAVIVQYFLYVLELLYTDEMQMFVDGLVCMRATLM